MVTEEMGDVLVAAVSQSWPVLVAAAATAAWIHLAATWAKKYFRWLDADAIPDEYDEPDEPGAWPPYVPGPEGWGER